MNTYVNKIMQIATPNKYTNWYISIVSRGISRATTRSHAKKLLGYTEGHHIYPRFASSTVEAKDKNNIVFLTAKEHFVCHWLLTKMLVGEYRQKSFAALGKFMQVNALQKRILNSNEYEAVRKANALWQHNGGNNRKKAKETVAKQTAEQKAEISKKRKVASKIHNSDRQWITNGVDTKRVKITEQIPAGWYIGRSNVASSWNAERTAASKLRFASMTQEERSAMYSSSYLRDETSLATWREKFKATMGKPKFMNNGIKNTFAPEHKQQALLDAGWVFGKLRDIR